MLELIKTSSQLWIKGTKRSDVIQVLKNQKVPDDQIRMILEFQKRLEDSPATAHKYLVEKLDLSTEEAKGVVEPILTSYSAHLIKRAKKNILYGSLWILLGIVATIYLPLDIFYYAAMIYGVVRIIRGVIDYGNS